MFNFFSRNNEPIKLWFDTDIHCHVLPGIDDGSPDAEHSVSIISDLRDLGIKRIIASPHVAASQFPNTPETLADSYNQLKNAMADAGLDMDITHSAEYRLDEGFANVMEGKQIIPYPGNYVLIENEWIQEPMNLDNIIFDLQVRGYNPIMAHPERFVYYHRHPERLDDLHTRVPFQINVLSLAGYYGKEIKAMAETLARKGYADFLGTDTHGLRHTETIREYLAGKDALRHRDLTARTIKNDIVFPA